MARTVNESAHAQRRQAFLDAAERLIQTRGYERMTVQDVLDAVQLSKGAFYHYFDSKQALLEALVVHLADAQVGQFIRDARRLDLSASDKLRRLFAEAGRRKMEAKEFWLALARVWYSDGNAAIRQRVELRVQEQLAPLLGQIVVEGVEEGVFTTPYPDQVGRILLALVKDVNDLIARLWLPSRTESPDRPRIEQTVAAYNDTMARMLGANAGALTLLDPAQVMAWFDERHDQTDDEPRSTMALA